VFFDPRLTEQAASFASGRRVRAALFASAALLIAFTILVRAVNHDEGQYVAAIAMMRHGWPYLDFPYLQTPLQPLLLSPLALLPAGWLLVAARCVNGLFALATLWLLHVAMRGRVRSRSAMIAIAALSCTEAFLLASSLARNDALPMMLIAGAIVALLRGVDRKYEAVPLAVAGLLLGLGTSAKISAAVPAAGAGLFLLLRARQAGIVGLVSFGLGAIGGLLPTLVLAISAPVQFGFGVFTYSLEAPSQWWTATGWQVALSPPVRIGILLALAGLGASIVALPAAVLDRRRSDDRLLLDLMIIGGLIGAYMPEPPFTQYLIPLLPPLFARFALAIDGPKRRWHGPVLVLTVVASIAGLFYTARHAVKSMSRGVDLIHAFEQGREVARLANGGPIVSLATAPLAGADTNLDRGFTTGPFLYRTFGALSEEALNYGYSPNWQRIGQAFAIHPPELIFVGRERGQGPPTILVSARRQRPQSSLLPAHLEDPLISWAREHGYRQVPLAGGTTAFVRP